MNTLEYNGYKAEINFNGEDEIFHGRVVDIGDLVIFEGSSVEELKEAFKEAIDDYTQTNN